MPSELNKSKMFDSIEINPNILNLMNEQEKRELFYSNDIEFKVRLNKDH